MDLIKKNWNKKDIEKFNNYLESLANKNKIKWTTNIINTKIKVLAIPSKKLREISKEIYRGNYYSFLNHMNYDSFEAMTINSYLISKIKDVDKQIDYINKYSLHVDNWANCDSLKINIKNNEDKYLNLINNYMENDLPFIRRIGIRILFEYINYDVEIVFKILDKFNKETDYYVNMINAWILCECFIKQRDKTLLYFKNNKLNKFTINKAISKCRDSYRVSKEDKEMLLKYKKRD